MKEPAIIAEADRCLPWRERRDWYRARLEQQPLAGFSVEEVEAHFAGMPARYWERVTESELCWGLETVQGFLRTVATPNTPATTPFVNWRTVPQSNWTRVLLCTWDRQGLLAKAAAAFSAVRLNIRRADVFTRADNVVLDMFRVAEFDGRSPANLARLEEMTFLLGGALSEPPRFASVWACSRHKFLAPPAVLPVRITFDNHSSRDTTVVQVIASDRLGLLYDILQSISDAGLNLAQALIETDDDLAHDLIHVTDSTGQKVLAARRLEQLRQGLEKALTLQATP